MAAVSDSTDNLTPRRTRMRAAVAISAVIHVVVLSVALAWWNRPDPIEAPLTEGIAVDLVPPTEPSAEKKPEPPRERQPPLVPPKISSSALVPPPAAPASPVPPPERAPAKPPEPEAPSAALKPIAPEWTETPGESRPGEATASTPPSAAEKAEPVLPDPEVVEQMSRLNRPGEFDAVAEAKAKLSDEEVAAFRQQIRKCWTRPAALANAQRLQATVRVVLRNDGSLRGEPILVQAPAAALGPLLVKTAIAAVRQCQPYTMLPRAKYAEWQVLDLRFTPDGPSGM